jgi:hypothetical protein
MGRKSTKIRLLLTVYYYFLLANEYFCNKQYHLYACHVNRIRLLSLIYMQDIFAILMVIGLGRVIFVLLIESKRISSIKLVSQCDVCSLNIICKCCHNLSS